MVNFSCGKSGHGSVRSSLESGFMAVQIPLLQSRFSLAYTRDYSCIEYFLSSLETKKPISKNLIVSHDVWSRSLYVSKFYPELFRETQCKYLSAACFYLMIRHAAGIFGLRDHFPVCLETEASVFEAFYSRLKEFDFGIAYTRTAARVCLKGCFHDLSITTGCIREVPFH